MKEMRIQKLRRLSLWKPAKFFTSYNLKTFNQRKWLCMGGFDDQKHETDFRIMTYNILADSYLCFLIKPLAESFPMSRRIGVIIKYF
jgi:hypothetical protein